MADAFSNLSRVHTCVVSIDKTSSYKVYCSGYQVVPTCNLVEVFPKRGSVYEAGSALVLRIAIVVLTHTRVLTHGSSQYVTLPRCFDDGVLTIQACFYEFEQWVCHP